MKKAPKIRFDGYTEDWEQRKLGEVAIKIGSGKTPSGGNNAYVDSGITMIRSQNINDDKVNLSDAVFIDAKTDLLMKNSQVYKNDVLLNITGASIGRSAVYKGLEHANVNQHVCIIRPVEGYFSEFIQLNLASNSGQRQIESSQAGGGREGLNFQQIGKMCFMFPSMAEQTKIGEYFSALDHLITLHQKECEKMLDFKDYMLSKMFPMGDEDYPDVRVQGYSASWTRRKFADFSFPTGEKNKNNLPLEPYAITKEYGFIAQSEAHEEFGYMKDADRTLYIIVRPNSFAYNPARINIGSLGYYEGTENVIVSSLYEVFQTDDGVDDTFLQYWFKTNEFKRWIERLQEGSVRLYFYYDKLCECTLMMPCLQEQQAIGQYFRKLDELILLHQHEVEAYKKMKQYMLQNMFV